MQPRRRVVELGERAIERVRFVAFLGHALIVRCCGVRDEGLLRSQCHRTDRNDWLTSSIGPAEHCNDSCAWSGRRDARELFATTSGLRSAKALAHAAIIFDEHVDRADTEALAADDDLRANRDRQLA